MDEKVTLMRAGQRKRERKVDAKAYMPLYALVLPIQHCSLGFRGGGTGRSLHPPHTGACRWDRHGGRAQSSAGSCSE